MAQNKLRFSNMKKISEGQKKIKKIIKAFNSSITFRQFVEKCKAFDRWHRIDGVGSWDPLTKLRNIDANPFLNYDIVHLPELKQISRFKFFFAKAKAVIKSSYDDTFSPSSWVFFYAFKQANIVFYNVRNYADESKLKTIIPRKYAKRLFKCVRFMNYNYD